MAYWFDCIGPFLAQNSAIIGPILARYKIVCWVVGAKTPKNSLVIFFNFNITFLAAWGCASDFLKMLPKFKWPPEVNTIFLWAQKL